MKIINVVAEVPDNVIDKLKDEIQKLIQDKYGGAVTGLNTADAPPKGAGATLGGVA